MRLLNPHRFFGQAPRQGMGLGWKSLITFGYSRWFECPSNLRDNFVGAKVEENVTYLKLVRLNLRTTNSRD